MLNDFFDEQSALRNMSNKIIHKQGFDTFYSKRADKKECKEYINRKHEETKEVKTESAMNWQE